MEHAPPAAALVGLRRRGIAMVFSLPGLGQEFSRKVRGQAGRWANPLAGPFPHSQAASASVDDAASLLKRQGAGLEKHIGGPSILVCFP